MSPQNSTPVLLPVAPVPDRPGPDRRQARAQTTFRRLEAISPALAARCAAHLWFRLPRPPDPTRRRRHLPTGGWPVSFPVRGVGTVRGIEFGPEEGPVALLLHGWSGWREQLAAHIEPLASQGFRVLAYDAPSHGASDSGRHGRHRTSVVEMADALAAVAAAVGPVGLVVAHSLGGMSLAWAAQQRGLRFGAAALIAPATSVAPVVDTFQRRTGIGPGTRQRLIPMLEQRIGVGLDDFDVAALAAGFASHRPIPMLAVHDIDDAELPVAGARTLVAAWPHAELVLTTGLGHRRILWDPSVVQQVSTFAAKVKNT